MKKLIILSVFVSLYQLVSAQTPANCTATYDAATDVSVGTDPLSSHSIVIRSHCEL
jgi:hypothetical protein